MDETAEIEVKKSKTHWVNLDERIYQKLERLKEETGCRTTKEMIEEVIGFYSKN